MIKNKYMYFTSLFVLIICFKLIASDILQTFLVQDIRYNEISNITDIFWNIISYQKKNSCLISVIFMPSCNYSANELKKELTEGIHIYLKIPVKIIDLLSSKYEEDNTHLGMLKRYRKKRSPFGISYLIVAKDIFELLQYINSTNPSWRPDANILFLISEKSNSSCYESLFKTLWIEYNIINAILYVNDNNAENVWSYNPFSKRSDMEYGEMFSLIKNGVFDNYLSVNIKHLNMNGYVVKASVLTISPFNNTIKYMDHYILETLAKELNFTADTEEITTVESVELENGTITGALNEIAYNNKDLVMISKIVQNFISIDVEYVLPVVRNGKCCVVVPKAAKVPSWLSLIGCCSKEVWVYIFLNSVVCLSFWYCLRKLSFQLNLNKRETQIQESLRIILNALLPTTFSKLTLIKLISERTFISSCMLWSIVISNVFQGVLFKFLKNPNSYKEINNLQDVLESGLPLFADDLELYEYFHTLDTDAANKLFERLEVNDRGSKILKNIATYKNETVLITYLTATQIMETSPYFNKIHIAEECPITYIASYFVPRGSVYLPHIHDVVTRLYEAGFTEWWYKSAWDQYFLQYRFKYAREINVSYAHKPFSLKDIFVAFIVLLIGICVSILIAIIEYLKK
ncbi:hypothetical protein L9F63_017857 [Diploptera punctata]|uniref:Uncharacterized protein n=1 Tax=Diploptera punctata TaxID=6984 RepID=A0AAD7ZXY1_DIPPU|nr:hypothetical protein L9F63_017857 [Diploptera punctata]